VLPQCFDLAFGATLRAVKRQAATHPLSGPLTDDFPDHVVAFSLDRNSGNLQLLSKDLVLQIHFPRRTVVKEIYRASATLVSMQSKSSPSVHAIANSPSEMERSDS